ncbi:DNA-binding protein [Mycobacteroides saopaulense]|uniref:DNA-binding protein n=1 Tax=Mycobacteroides saopaulense TaxID=1578165 RepID=A0A1X0IQE4_9MYCO|nr:YbaB/EbfC family nucleoid-associated protein [Mycobacteroides saopaulense]ORB50613.1 DNA-binding protein [Mycobacteroides saopaulense]
MNADAGLDDLMRAAAQVNQSVAQVRGYGESAGGRVKIEVTGDGEISNMYLDDQTRTMPAHELSRAIRDAHRTAINDAAQRVQVLQSQITDSSYVTTLLDKLGTADSRSLNATPESNIVSRRPHVVGGMTEHELDASQEAFNFDPLGRRRWR